MNRPYWQYALPVASIITLLLMGFFTFLFAWPVPMIQGDRIKVQNSDLQSGDLIQYQVENCHSTPSLVDISRTLVSIDTPPTIEVDLSYVAKRNFQCKNIALIPLAVPTGTYLLKISITEPSSRLQNKNIQFVSDPVKITNDSVRCRPAERLRAALRHSTHPAADCIIMKVEPESCS